MGEVKEKNLKPRALRPSKEKLQRMADDIYRMEIERRKRLGLSTSEYDD